MTTALAQYDAMRLQVQRCARVDEAAEIRNKADKLRAYAKQAKDRDLQRWMGEITLRATIRLGQLSKDLEKAQPTHSGVQLPSGGKLKSEALSDAGISKSVAQRAEALAGARNDINDESGLAVEAMGVALETAEIYFQQCRQAETTPNHRQLKGIIEKTLDDRFGKPERAQRIRDLVGVARTCIIEIGRELIAAKSEVGHGGWLPWLHEEFGWSEQTARRYMEVARAFKSLTLSDFSGITIDATALYALSAPGVPQEARDAVIEQAEAGDHVTKADAEVLIACL